MRSTHVAGVGLSCDLSAPEKLMDVCAPYCCACVSVRVSVHVFVLCISALELPIPWRRYEMDAS